MITNQLIVNYTFIYTFLQHLIALVDRKTGKRQKERPRFIKQDNIAVARLQTSGVVCIEKFADFPQMGRFTLRDEGTVTMPFVLIKNKKPPPTLQGQTNVPSFVVFPVNADPCVPFFRSNKPPTSRPQDFTRRQFLAVFFRVSHDVLKKDGLLVVFVCSEELVLF